MIIIMAWENQIWENQLGRIVVGRKLTWVNFRAKAVPKLVESESGIMLLKIEMNLLSRISCI